MCYEIKTTTRRFPTGNVTATWGVLGLASGVTAEVAENVTTAKIERGLVWKLRPVFFFAVVFWDNLKIAKKTKLGENWSERCNKLT